MSRGDLSSAASFEDILDQLERLGREHLLFYRERVGDLWRAPRRVGPRALLPRPQRRRRSLREEVSR